MFRIFGRRGVWYNLAIMASRKKHQSKKHRFKYADPHGGVASAGLEAEVRDGVVKGRAAGAGFAQRDFGYVKSDLRRIGVMAVGLVGLEFLLWVVLGREALGNAVYGLIRF
jgi:hypothetical protein